MFYEESTIAGILHWRSTPDGMWRPLAPQHLTVMVERLKNADHNADVWCERATKAEAQVALSEAYESRLLAEVERLRAALQGLIVASDYYTDSAPYITALEAARAVLSPGTAP